MRLLITMLVLFACMHASSQTPDIDADNNQDRNIQQHAHLLRFTNSDTLHGTFHGFSASRKLEWKNPEASQPISFSTDKIQRITLNRGHAKVVAQPKSIVTLSNGDILHGEVSSINSEQLQMETEYLGKVQIPKNRVSSVAFQPHGGKLEYYGPLNTDGWQIIPTAAAKKAENKKDPDHAADNDSDDQETKIAWKHVSNAWYSVGLDHHCLVRNNALPEKCRLSFEIAWRDSFNLQVGFFADLSPPEENNRNYSLNSQMSSAIGNSYMLYMNAHSINLYTHSFDKDGNLKRDHIEGNASINLRTRDKAHVELRIDRKDKLLLLYIDGEYKMKWPLEGLSDDIGQALAFFKPTYSTRAPCPIRISDITISAWNGLEDSARSTRHDEHDIVMLTNGLDRFSGVFTGLEEGLVSFKGKYGNQLKIPSEQIAEVNFASKSLHAPDQKKDQRAVYFYTLPYGRISATPIENHSGACTLYSEAMGELKLDTDYVNIIDFSHQNNLLDFWDDHF